jgi:hypothetical protein
MHSKSSIVRLPVNRLVRYRWWITLAALALFAKVLFNILAEYRWYFPADFDRSAFLAGRRFTFVGIYRAAFYAHICVGPPVLLLALFLVMTGGRRSLAKWHRIAGRLLAALVLLVLVPSGLIMANQAYAGATAGLGFALLSLITGACVSGAAYFAIRRKYQWHQQFASRSFILLVSPMLLRVASGAAIVMDCESELFYQLNAWLSWLLPLLIYESWLWWRRPSGSQPRMTRSIA